jgi:hypothetical protein
MDKPTTFALQNDSKRSDIMELADDPDEGLTEKEKGENV